MQLRQDYRILGSLVGTSTVRGSSLDMHVMPVELTMWETALLVEENIARLLSKQQSMLEPPKDEQIIEYKHNCATLRAEQELAMQEERFENARRNMPSIISGKRRKQNSGEIKGIDEAEILKSVADNFLYDDNQTLIETDCAHPRSHFGFICNLPKDRSLLYCVFRDCWLRGYYVVSGESFGGDFLLYPGDPLLYHASHIVILLDTRKITPLELITKTRISVSVNKLCIMAYFAENPRKADDNECDWPEIVYQTVHWNKTFTQRGGSWENKP